MSAGANLKAIPPVHSTGHIHLRHPLHPNSRKALCGSDYQYRNNYVSRLDRVTCELCIYLVEQEGE